MADITNVSGTSQVFNTPNYSGTLYTASPIETPFLTLIGGVGGAKAKKTKNFEFPTCSLYATKAASQPAISETGSLTAPTPYTYVRTQEYNVVQKHHESIAVSYDQMANGGRLSGINTAGAENNAQSELDFQTMVTLEKVAQDIEYSFLQGTYNKAASSTEINKTRGMLAAAGTQLDAESDTAFSKSMFDEIMLAAYTAGAKFKEFYVFTNGTLKQKITNAYTGVNGFTLPTTRTEAGVNITTITTDFGDVQIVLDRHMPNDALLGADLSCIAPVEMDVEGKGNFFRESLGIVGAAEAHQLFGFIGLDHGPAFMHWAITNIDITSTDDDGSTVTINADAVNVTADTVTVEESGT